MMEKDERRKEGKRMDVSPYLPTYLMLLHLNIAYISQSHKFCS
jgi:hypothetical protein